jgi:hypothetical protein
MGFCCAAAPEPEVSIITTGAAAAFKGAVVGCAGAGGATPGSLMYQNKPMAIRPTTAAPTRTGNS